MERRADERRACWHIRVSRPFPGSDAGANEVLPLHLTVLLLTGHSLGDSGHEGGEGTTFHQHPTQCRVSLDMLAGYLNDEPQNPFGRGTLGW